MRRKPATEHLRGSAHDALTAPPRSASGNDPWRTLEALGVYRICLCVLILLLTNTPFPPQFLGHVAPELFRLTSLAYTIFAGGALVFLRLRRPGVTVQAAAQISGDFAALLMLAYASGGAPSGLGMLLITPVAAAALIFRWRLAIASAAVASLSLLGLEVWRHLSGSPLPPGYTQAGLLGLTTFIIALAGSTLAKRARESEALAVRVGGDLAKLARLNETIIQKLDAGVLVVDAAGRIQVQNNAAQRLLGGDHDRRSIAQREPELWASLRDWMGRPERSAGRTLTTSNGTQLWPQFTRLGQGEQAQILMVLEDASRIASTAQQLKLAALGRLTASIAHEIRNPLSAIRQAGQLLSESEAVKDQDRDLIAIVDRQTERINKIVEDVLGLSRGEQVLRQQLELGDFVRRRRKEYLEGLDHEPPEIAVKAPADPLYTAFDPLHLERVLYNLWDNSRCHAQSEDGLVRISVELHASADRQGAEIDISDNGPGIPEALRQEIFEPFFSTNHFGTGLGLYIARELCESHGGSLQYLDRDGAGAGFRIKLPVVPAVTESR